MIQVRELLETENCHRRRFSGESDYWTTRYVPTTAIEWSGGAGYSSVTNLPRQNPETERDGYRIRYATKTNSTPAILEFLGSGNQLVTNVPISNIR